MFHPKFYPKSVLTLLLVSVSTTFLGFSRIEERTSKIFIDKGVCPFECCIYQEWKVTKDTKLVDRIDGKTQVGVAKKGSRVEALTGEVHTVPLKVVDKEGKILYLLTYQGEGVWKAWDDGKVVEGIEEKDWEPRRMPEHAWWIQIKLKNGTVGWTKEPRNFGGNDSCSG